jgi:hypothetical protein
MNFLERIERAEAERHLPDNVVPTERVERRRVARWLEIQRERGNVVDLTGYITGPDAA